MSQIKVKRFFYINSENLLTDTNSSFSVNLQIPDYENYDRVCLTQANIPVSYYMIRQGYNTFTLIEGGTSVPLSLTPANYNANSFSLIVSALLTANSPNGLTYTITYPVSFTDANTGKFTYSVNTSTIPVSLSFPPLSPITEQFGFNIGSTQKFTAGSGVSTLVSTNVLFFIPENSLFIHSNLCDAGYNDILQEIYSGNSSVFGNITWVNPDPCAYSKKLATNKAQAITFSITDAHRLPIYLNGLTVLLTVCLFKDNDYYRKSEEFMKYQLGNKISE